MKNRLAPQLRDLHHIKICYSKDHYCGHPRQGGLPQPLNERPDAPVVLFPAAPEGREVGELSGAQHGRG